MSLTPSAENILAVFEKVDLADASAGIDWYADARAEADKLADRYGIAPLVAVGVIAAFSPLCEWKKNLEQADKFLASGGVRSVHTKQQMDKARRILAGENILRTLGGRKTQNFYLAIQSRGRRGLAIDRHAWRIAVGVHLPDAEVSVGVKAYREAVEAYREAARRLNAEGLHITATELQAVTWEWWRKAHIGVRVARNVKPTRTVAPVL